MAEAIYWNGRKLRVTSSKLVYRGAVYPISAVTCVDVRKLPESETESYQHIMSWGGVLFVLGFVLAIIALGSLFGGARDIGFALLLPTAACLAAGAKLASMGYDADRRAASKRQVYVQLTSGDDFAVTTSRAATARKIAKAADSAITARETGTTQTSSVAAELNKLASLRDAGVLSSGDWERAKDLFLGQKPDRREAAISHLRKLHALHSDGVLSESEFNGKKWDILSRRD